MITISRKNYETNNVCDSTAICLCFCYWTADKQGYLNTAIQGLGLQYHRTSTLRSTSASYSLWEIQPRPLRWVCLQWRRLTTQRTAILLLRQLSLRLRLHWQLWLFKTFQWWLKGPYQPRSWPWVLRIRLLPLWYWFSIQRLARPPKSHRTILGSFRGL